jgi:hypothetical protein
VSFRFAKMLGSLAVATVAVAAPLVALTPGIASAALPTIAVTEVAPWSSGSSPVAADWFELTNTGASPVTITGWKMDDDSALFANAVALNGVTSIAPGESVIFIETTSATTVNTFKSTWFGGSVPAGLQIGTYSGSGVGLSTTSDAVTIFDSGGTQVTKVTFGASDSTLPLQTFDNTAGVTGAISTLSQVGTNGAFAAVNDTNNEVGSPGTIGGTPPVTPEVPYAVILPVGAVVVLGAGTLVSRRRRRATA